LIPIADDLIEAGRMRSPQPTAKVLARYDDGD